MVPKLSRYFIFGIVQRRRDAYPRGDSDLFSEWWAARTDGFRLAMPQGALLRPSSKGTGCLRLRVARIPLQPETWMRDGRVHLSGTAAYRLHLAPAIFDRFPLSVPQQGCRDHLARTRQPCPTLQ